MGMVWDGNICFLFDDMCLYIYIHIYSYSTMALQSAVYQKKDLPPREFAKHDLLEVYPSDMSPKTIQLQ